MAKKEAKGRNVRVTKEDNRLFKILLLDLIDMGVFRTPDELADEIFTLGLHTKIKTLKSK